MEEKSGLELCEVATTKVVANVHNHDFIIHPNVFNPDFFLGPTFFAQSLISIIHEFQPKQPTVLDIGTGAGYYAILAILNGASHVTSTDINNDAIINARENVQKYELEDYITILQSDIFD